MKIILQQISEPESVHSIAKKLRNHTTAFHRAVRMKSLKLTEFKKFCQLCDSEIFVRKADGTEIKINLSE
jgi:hypothetical protein